MVHKVAIIGAGASGLTAARQALAYGFEPVIFEQLSDLGGIWRYSENSNVRSVSWSTTNTSSKELSAFSDFAPSENYATFMHHTEVLDYLEAYAVQFKLRGYIKFNTKVTAVTRADDWAETGDWIINYNKGDANVHTEKFGAVLMCTGMYSAPARPFEFRKETEFQGRISHSSQLKNAASLAGKRVVIVGFGNSAIQVAVDAAPLASEVFLSTRRGTWLLPTTTANSTPWDLTYNNRLSVLGRKFVPKFVRNWLWEGALNERFNHHAAGILPDHHFLAANVTFAKEGLFDYLQSGRIKIVENLLSFTDTGVELINKTVIDNVDEVIFATGYAFDFSIIEEGKLIFVRENDFHLYKHIFHPVLSENNGTHGKNNLGVIGHVQPFGGGGSFAVAEMQARYFFDVLSQNSELPSAFAMKAALEEKRCEMSIEYVKTRRHTQIEDMTTYIDDLANEIGAAPSKWQLLRTNPKLGLKVLFGPTYPYQYRINGDHAWSDAGDALMTAHARLYPRGQPSWWKYPKTWQLVLIVFVIFYVWLHWL